MSVIRKSRSGIATTANHVHTHTGGGLGFGLRELFIFLFFRNLCREFVSVNTICERKFTGSTSTPHRFGFGSENFLFFYFSKFVQGPDTHESVIRKSRSACLSHLLDRKPAAKRKKKILLIIHHHVTVATSTIISSPTPN